MLSDWEYSAEISFFFFFWNKNCASGDSNVWVFFNVYVGNI